MVRTLQFIAVQSLPRRDRNHPQLAPLAADEDMPAIGMDGETVGPAIEDRPVIEDFHRVRVDTAQMAVATGDEQCGAVGRPYAVERD